MRESRVADLDRLAADIERSSIPHRDLALAIIAGKGSPAARIWRLRTADNGALWEEVKPLLSDLRYASVTFTYKRLPAAPEAELPVYDNVDTYIQESEEPVAPADCVLSPAPRRPLYLALKTNMLYDALLVPNIGAEVYLGKMWSISAAWGYAWWKSDRRHNYWRYYGGDLALRRWFGSKAKDKPLTGHHLGIYGQIITYDFELGGKGYMGNKFNYGAGIEYGFSLPIARRLNIDFSIGVGYLGGSYYEYTPIDGHYVWQATKNRHWVGPTKAEISLVWLIGHGNTNRKKGGDR